MRTLSKCLSHCHYGTLRTPPQIQWIPNAKRVGGGEGGGAMPTIFNKSPTPTKRKRFFSDKNSTQNQVAHPSAKRALGGGGSSLGYVKIQYGASY